MDFSHVQQGSATLVATADDEDDENDTKDAFQRSRTRLTTVSHRAPVRLVPTPDRRRHTGAAHVSISHYGGGMAAGDTADVTVHVQPRAKLVLHTQGSNRIYKQPPPSPQQSPPTTTTAVAPPLPLRPTTSQWHVRVAEQAVLVHVPDPVSLQAGCVYQQSADYTLHRHCAACVVVDWLAAGRLQRGERWQHHTPCTSRTQWQFLDRADPPPPQQSQQRQRPPFLLDAQSILPLTTTTTAPHHGMDWHAGTTQFHAVATVMVYGSATDRVVQRWYRVQHALCALHTTVRNYDDDHRPHEKALDYHDNDNDNNEDSALLHDLLQYQLSGSRVVVGVSAAAVAAPANEDGGTTSTTATTVYTARVAAASNEDIYRLLHYCLQPLHTLIGTECYKDRLTATRSSPALHVPPPPSPLPPPPALSRPDVPFVHADITLQEATSVTTIPPRNTTNDPWSRQHSGMIFPSSSSSMPSNNYWTAYMLADSALPTGSFAHSSGMEVASQLGLLTNNSQDIATFVQTSVRSTVQLSTPLLVGSSRLVARLLVQFTSRLGDDDANAPALDAFVLLWMELDAYAQALMVTNAPACRASLDQGRSLLRVALQMIQSSPAFDRWDQRLLILQALQDAIADQQYAAGHASTVFGIVTQLLQVKEDEASHLFGYCVARDLVSSAVRLNLVGPMAGQAILWQAQQAAEIGIASATDAMIKSKEMGNDDDDFVAIAVATATGCAPVLEAVHACHDVLATRLFRT